MNRNLILVLLLAVAIGIAFVAYKSKEDTSASFNRAESNFKIDDIQTIDRIIITQKNGVRSDLKRVGDYWMVNDSHRVRQTNIEHLLNGIQRQHLDHIPNIAASKNVINSMAVNGIHVEIFDKSGNELLDYYIGGVTPDEKATFFLKEGSSQPYALHVPGFEGSLRPRYSLRPVDWRDIRFWVEETEKIDTFRVNYPKQIQHSFILYKSGSGYAVDPLYTTTPRKSGVNQNRVNSYLTTLSRLAGESFLPDSPEKDSIFQMVPFVEIDMIYPDKKTWVRFYPAGTPVKSEYSTDIPSYYIDYAGKDFMIGQHEVMKGAFRSYDYFFE